MKKIQEKLISYSKLHGEVYDRRRFDDDVYIKEFIKNSRIEKNSWHHLNGELVFVHDYKLIEKKIKLIEDCLPYTHSIYFELEIKTSKKSRYGVIYETEDTYIISDETSLSRVYKNDSDIYKEQIAVFDDIYNKFEKIYKSLALIEDKALRASSEFNDISRELISINRTINKDIITIDPSCLGTGKVYYNHSRPEGKYQ